MRCSRWSEGGGDKTADEVREDEVKIEFVGRLERKEGGKIGNKPQFGQVIPLNAFVRIPNAQPTTFIISGDV